MEETDADDNLEEAYLVEFPSPPITEYLGCDFKLIPQIYPEMRRMVVEFREPDCEDGDEEGSTLEINEDKEEYLLLGSNAPADLAEAEMTQMAEQSEHGEQQSRNAESMERVERDSVGEVRNLDTKLEAKFVRGYGGTLEHDDESLRTGVRRVHWKRRPASPNAHGEEMLHKLRKENEFYELYEDEMRGDDVDAKTASEDILMVARRGEYETADDGDYETADEGHWETADEDDYETADEGDHDWERYNTEIDEAVLNQHCGIEENSNMKHSTNEQQWQETEKSIGGEQKYGVGCENSTDITLESKQIRGEMEQTIVGNEDVMSGLKYRFVLPEKVESQPLTDARKREWERSTDCSEQLDEEKVMRRDNELEMCEDEAQMQFDVEETLEETDVHSSFEVKEYNRMEDFLANSPEKEMMRLTDDKKTVFS